MHWRSIPMTKLNRFSAACTERNGSVAVSFFPLRKAKLQTALVTLLLSALSCFLPSTLQAQDTPALQQATTFISADFIPPTLVETQQFILIPLGPAVVDVDYAAYMSSVDHLQATFSRGSSWPNEDITIADAMLDMENEARRFKNRESFAYAVLSTDETMELGSLYIYPSDKAGFDAVIRMWVTQQQYDLGFDDTLFQWSKTWVKEAWPFSNAAFPGRDIPWAKWDLLGAKE